MQEREFWQLLEEVLGRSYGRALARDQVLDRLNGLTAVEALEMGKFQNAGISRESGLRRVEMHVLRPQWPIELAQMDDAVLR